LVISFVTKHIPGTTIDWDGSAQKITITTAEGKIIKLWVGNPKAEVSGVMVDIDPAYPGQGSPYIKDSRTKVPMRFVGNHLNAKVDWDGSTSTVILSVRDTVNCGCAWTQKGRFLLQNTATKNTFKFDTNCDGVPEAIYSGDTSLININPEDGYHGKIGGYMGCVTLCVDNNTITKWKAFPNDQDCCEIPCCTFTTTNVVPPDLIRELAPGESYTYKYKFTNTCTTDHMPFVFSFSHRQNITSITPDTFTLAPGLSQTIEVKFQMPTNAKSDAEVVFSFNVNTDCGHNEQISWALHSRTTCCDWLFRMKPEQKERKLYMCPGETLSVDDYEIFNNCPIGGNALTITISWPPDKGVISVSPKSFTLQPQERMALNITIKMITSCRPDESSTFPININSKECVKKTVNIVAYCKQC